MSIKTGCSELATDRFNFSKETSFRAHASGFHLNIREIIVPQAEETLIGVFAEFKKDSEKPWK